MVAARTNPRPAVRRARMRLGPRCESIRRPHLWFLIVSGVLLAGWMGF